MRSVERWTARSTWVNAARGRRCSASTVLVPQDQMVRVSVGVTMIAAGHSASVLGWLDLRAARARVDARLQLLGPNGNVYRDAATYHD